MEGLIKAGYKENPSDYYRVIDENKLTGQEIEELIFGKTIEGTYFKIEWSVFRSKDGKTESSNSFHIHHKGKSWIEGDTVCNQYESRFDGLKYCSEVYKVSEGKNMMFNKYISLNDFMIAPFSIKK